MTRISMLSAVFLLFVCNLARGADAPPPADLTSAEKSQIGKFVLEKQAEGLKGEALAHAIVNKLKSIQAARKNAKPPADPATADERQAKDDAATAAKFGVQPKDVPGMGGFVTKELADGLRGQDLSDAIHKELDQRKVDKQKQDGSAAGDKGGKPADPGQGASAGNGAGNGNGPGNGSGPGDGAKAGGPPSGKGAPSGKGSPKGKK